MSAAPGAGGHAAAVRAGGGARPRLPVRARPGGAALNSDPDPDGEILIANSRPIHLHCIQYSQNV